MTVAKKRIKTKFMGGGVNGKVILSQSEEWGPGLVEEWTVQDNITIIGAEVVIEADVQDANSNADGEHKGIVEVTRAATIERDGGIVSVQQQNVWNGIIHIGGGLRTTERVMFPEGYGIDVDEGEKVNLCAYFNNTAVGGDLSWFASARIYYVEN